MGIGFKELLLILLIVLILFGRGRIASVMGDIGKGVRSLREGLKGEGEAADPAKPLPKQDDTTTTNS